MYNFNWGDIHRTRVCSVTEEQSAVTYHSLKALMVWLPRYTSNEGFRQTFIDGHQFRFTVRNAGMTNTNVMMK